MNKFLKELAKEVVTDVVTTASVEFVEPIAKRLGERCANAIAPERPIAEQEEEGDEEENVK